MFEGQESHSATDWLLEQREGETVDLIVAIRSRAAFITCADDHEVVVRALALAEWLMAAMPPMEPDVEVQETKPHIRRSGQRISPAY